MKNKQKNRLYKDKIFVLLSIFLMFLLSILTIFSLFLLYDNNNDYQMCKYLETNHKQLDLKCNYFGEKDYLETRFIQTDAKTNLVISGIIFYKTDKMEESK